jgi:tetratricopeptide (TPR) repeat protein
MKLFFLLLLIVTSTLIASAQSPSDQQRAQAETAFEIANSLMEQRKSEQALTHYKQALAILPNEPAILFNAGLAAFSSKDFAFASEVWKKLKALEPLDWHARAKLVQVYQALGKTSERDKEREELFAMRKSGKPPELQQQNQYCREQFEVNGKKVVAFEHFELKGDRALRYVFSILNKTEDDEEYRISLGSYSFTNAVWRETTKPKPKDDERLFHLDGYFPGRHVTYGMFFPEPSYDEIRAKVVQILEGKGTPISGTTYGKTEAKPEPKPTPTPQ